MAQIYLGAVLSGFCCHPPWESCVLELERDESSFSSCLLSNDHSASQSCFVVLFFEEFFVRKMVSSTKFVEN